MLTRHNETALTGTAYQVRVFALIHNRQSYLLTRVHQPLLPGGGPTLPGLIINVLVGNNVIESQLRRTILSQVGIGVGDLRLVGSHAARGVEEGTADARLNIIFGTEYCSGILTPNSSEIIQAEWRPRDDILASRDTPEWLQHCVREYEVLLPAQPLPDAAKGFGFKFGRKKA